jgi:hypothetical protein
VVLSTTCRPLKWPLMAWRGVPTIKRGPVSPILADLGYKLTNSLRFFVVVDTIDKIFELSNFAQVLNTQNVILYLAAGIKCHCQSTDTLQPLCLNPYLLDELRVSTEELDQLVSLCSVAHENHLTLIEREVN